ncbi:hypothetical protein [Rhodococcus sp. ACT016]
MTKYLISFPSGAMVFPDEDLQAVPDRHVHRNRLAHSRRGQITARG